MRGYYAEEAHIEAEASICWLVCLFKLGVGTVIPEIVLLSRGQSINLLELPLWYIVPWLAAKHPPSHPVKPLLPPRKGQVWGIGVRELMVWDSARETSYQLPVPGKTWGKLIHCESL